MKDSNDITDKSSLTKKPNVTNYKPSASESSQSNSTSKDNALGEFIQATQDVFQWAKRNPVQSTVLGLAAVVSFRSRLARRAIFWVATTIISSDLLKKAGDTALEAVDSEIQEMRKSLS